VPTVAIILPVLNGEKYLQEALSSIAIQCDATCEICVVNDGSTDNTSEIIDNFNYSRLTKLVNFRSMGVAFSLNRAIKETCSDYIIRIDADDISMPQRLSRQVAFMENNPSVGVSGSWVKHIGRYRGTIERRPVGSEVVKAFMVLDNPIFHPTCIMRRSSFVRHSLSYDKAFSRSEDYDLWERASHCFPLDNIPEPLVGFRVHNESVTETHGQAMWQQTYEILQRNLSRLGMNIKEAELAFHRSIAHGALVNDVLALDHASSWFQRLLDVNDAKGVYNSIAFRKAIGFVWFRLCRNNALLGPATWQIYNKSSLSDYFSAPVRDRSLFLVSLLYHFLLKKR